jgi:hypothetical protein
MTTNIGSSTSFPAIVPDLTDTADIQVALRLLAYGTSSNPADNAAIETNSVFGKIRDLTTGKANVASPTFTGTVVLPTGTSSAAPLKLISGTNRTTAEAGSLEYNGTSLFFTPSGTTRKKITYEEDTGHILLHSGTVAGSASAGTASLVSGRDFSDYKKLQIVFSAIGISRPPAGRFLLRLNTISSGTYRMAYSNFAATTPTQASTLTETGYLIANSSGTGSVALGSQIIVEIINPGNNVTTKHVSWQNSNGFGYGTNNSISDPIGTISIATSSNIPDFSWEIYGIK